MNGRVVGVRVPVGVRFLSSPCRPDRLRGLFLRGGGGQSDRGLKLTTHFKLVPRSRIRGSIYALPIRLHGVVLLPYLKAHLSISQLISESVLEIGVTAASYDEASAHGT
jgi:hypothetical protein